MPYLLFCWHPFRLIWPNLGKYNPNTAVKFALALALVGLGFGALVMGINLSGTGSCYLVDISLFYIHVES
jgi:POT family proton-dependent oligopeptide transporter